MGSVASSRETFEPSCIPVSRPENRESERERESVSQEAGDVAKEKTKNRQIKTSGIGRETE